MRQEVLTTLKLIDDRIAVQRANDDSLLSGNLGLAIYHCLMLKLFDDDRATAIEIFSEVLERLRNSESSLKTYQYSNGLSGLGMVAQFLIDEELIDFDIDDDLELIDEFIYEKAIAQIKNGYIEFLHGGSGTLYYFNSRKDNDKISQYKEEIILAILTEIEKDPLKVRPPRSLFTWTKNDDYDLSLSHGLCGLMLVLLSVLEKDGTRDNIPLNNYLEKATKFVVELKRDTDDATENFSYFPSYIENQATYEDISRMSVWPNSRLAWCYGDLGWILYFYKYGKYTSNPELLALADHLGSKILKRTTLKETASNATHLCHGHSGLALFYLKLFEASGRAYYQEAFEYWLKRTVEQVNVEIKDGTFKANSAETSFLEGLPGIGLVLYSYLSGDTNWANLLLLNK